MSFNRIERALNLLNRLRVALFAPQLIGYARLLSKEACVR